MKLLIATFLAAAALTSAACGGDEGDTTSTTTATTTATVDTGATGATGEGDAKPEPCPDAGAEPNLGPVTSYGVDCAAVEDAMKEIGAVSAEFRLGDFDCERESGTELSGLWRCNGEAGYFTFAFGD